VLAVDPPAGIVLSLALTNETGLLVCKSGDQRKEVFFKDGQPVYVTSNSTNELLGEYLVAQGAIDRKQLDSALEILPRFDGHMGDTLVALGMVSAVDLFRAIAEQIRMRFRELLFWHEGVYEFYRDTRSRPNRPEIAIDPFQFVGECLTEAAFAPAPDTIADLKDAVVDRTAKADELIDRLADSDAVRHHLQHLTEPTTMEALILGLRSTSEQPELLTAFYIAVETGIWSMEGPQLPWRLAKESPETD
jgi:serine/threonine-protein kinase